MSEVLAQILPPLQIAAAVGLVALLAYLGTLLVQFIRSRIKNEFLANVLARAATGVATAVKATAQEYVDALKAKSADGKLTPAEQNEALEEALHKAKSFVSLSELAKAFGLASTDAAEDLLVDKIEAAVKDLKQAPALGK
jgi:translation elongation factor EF-4